MASNTNNPAHTPYPIDLKFNELLASLLADGNGAGGLTEESRSRCSRMARELRLIVLNQRPAKDVAAPDLLKALEATLEWIDAIPKSVAEQLPAMPGIDRDWINDTIFAAKGGVA